MAVAKRQTEGADREPSLYGVDVHAWAMEQAALLRRLRPVGLDVDNLAEEIESVGRSERKEILSRLDVLLLHLLKARYQAEKRKGGWAATIRVQRHDLKEALSDSPSLAHLPAERLADRYVRACLEASAESGLPPETFPEACPFTIDEILDDGFFG